MPRSPSIQIRLAPFVYELLKSQAEYEKRSLSKMAAFLLEKELRGDCSLSEIRAGRVTAMDTAD